MSTATEKPVKKTPAFVLRAERAFQRAAETVRAEHRRYGTAPLVWNDELKGKSKG